MEEDKTKSSGVGGAQFYSGDIGKKSKPEYFVRVKKKTEPKQVAKQAATKAKNTLFKGWHKFITIGVIVLLAAGAAALILLSIDWSGPEPVVDKEEEALILLDDVMKYMLEQYDGTFDDIKGKLTRFIEETNNTGDTRAATTATIALAKLYTNNLYYPEAEKLLTDHIKASNDYSDKVAAIVRLISLYEDLGYTGKIIEYLELALTFPDEGIVLDSEDWDSRKSYFQAYLDRLKKESQE